MGPTEWFEVRAVATGVRVIAHRARPSDLSYLVEGDEAALLIDTGWGLGDLAGLAASLTDLPLTVVCTHGHPDHVLGGMQFPEIHLPPADLPLFEESYAVRRRETAGRIKAESRPEGFSPEDWISARPPLVRPVAAGDRFDLGGRILEAMPLPGHTPGSIVLFDDRERLLFTGDAIVGGEIWLHLPHSLPLRAYWQNLRRLREEAGRFDLMLPGHPPTPLPGAVLDGLIAGIAGILAGDRAGEFHQTFRGAGRLCKFEGCGILYNPEKLE